MDAELRDRVGMGAALATLVTSLRAGRNSTNIQVDTMRKTRTWISNAHDAGQEYSCESVVVWTGPNSMSRAATHLGNGTAAS